MLLLEYENLKDVPTARLLQEYDTTDMPEYRNALWGELQRRLRLDDGEK